MNTSQITKKRDPANSTPSLVVTAIVLSLLVGGIAGGIAGALTATIASDSDSTTTITNNAQSLEQTLVVQENSATIDVVDTVAKSVGSVIATKDVSAFSLSPNRSPFDFFFDTPEEEDQGPIRQEVSGGTGFIISSDGLILTNKHVVEDTDAEYEFLTNEDVRYEATVIGRDPFNDLAILKIDATDLPVVNIGDSSSIQLGQTVIAIGNTFSRYRNTVTKGIVSGIGRTIVAGNELGQTETLDEIIQTDAAINPGNSGGPLIDLSGSVIGINTAVSSGENIGFAIPVNAAKPIIKTAIDEGRVVRPFLGIRYIAITEDIQEDNDLPTRYGALIPESTDDMPSITPNSAADIAGLQEGDIILEIDGKRIDEDQTLAQIMRDLASGDTASLKVLRDGEELTIEATLGELEG